MLTLVYEPDPDGVDPTPPDPEDRSREACWTRFMSRAGRLAAEQYFRALTDDDGLMEVAA
jgi:hypothetical protein